MASAKPIVAVLLLVAVVGIAIGLIICVRIINLDDGSDSALLSASKTVQAFCGPTDYKEACVDSLSSLDANSSATPKDYLALSISAAMDAVNATIDKAVLLSREAANGEQKDAFADCSALLGFAIDELRKATSSVREVSVKAVVGEVDELRNRLSATISYQQSCLDIIDPPLKEEMERGMRNASDLTSNVLAIVSSIKDVYKRIGIEIKLINNHRRLVEHDGWLYAARRKLLEVRDMGPMEKPNAVVAQDRSGQFKTINAAIAAYPKNFKGRYVIYVKAGLYNEKVTIGKDMENVYMYGDGPRKTIVTGRLNKAQGTNTWRSATFSAIGNGFMCKSMGFQNTAGQQGHQAVALRVQSDQSVFYNCRIDGFQDSLYAQAHRQFYRNCVISGTVDFIFGDSSTVIQNSLIITRRPLDGQQNTVTAQGKFDPRESTGIVIHNCRIVPDGMLFPDRFKIPSFLGRPWKQYSTTVIMESTLADFIHPSGWMPWDGEFALSTLYYAEYGNRGPGATTTNRVNWKGYRVITDQREALKWTVGAFLQGEAWISAASTPYILELKIHCNFLSKTNELQMRINDIELVMVVICVRVAF
ncbi:hypothetical protein V2J09_014479 [Rumex salicifolius]